MQNRSFKKTLATGLLALPLALSMNLVIGCANSPIAPAENVVAASQALVKKTHPCLINKIAFDIGSSSTKVKAAQVDRCQHKIGNVFFEKTVKIAFKDNLKLSAASELSSDFIIQSAQKLKELKVEAESLEPKIESDKEFEIPHQFFAVATAGLREAKNANEFVAEANKISGLEIRIISQEEEARLGLAAIEGMSGNRNEPFIVWDIGGGSQQITLKQGKNLEFKFASYASVGFRNKVISEVKKQDPAMTKSPNPLDAIQLRKSVSIAESMARDNFKGAADLFKKANKVYGVGGVWGQSLARQSGSEVISISSLNAALKKQTDKSDSDIGGDFADTDVTNIALVLGQMRFFHIKEVQAIKVNLADGLLFQNLKDQ